ncbi:MAG TPA: WG repeat-containing protein [Bacteroidia bacterium]
MKQLHLNLILPLLLFATISNSQIITTALYGKGKFFRVVNYDSISSETYLGFDGFTGKNIKSACPTCTYGPCELKGCHGDSISTYFEGHRLNFFYDGKHWALADPSGKIVSEFKYDMLYYYLPGGSHLNTFWDLLLLAKYNGKWGLLNSVGKEIVPFDYELPMAKSDYLGFIFENVQDSCSPDDMFCETRMLKDGVYGFPMIRSLLVMKQNGKYGATDTTTQKVIVPFVYDRINCGTSPGMIYLEHENSDIMDFLTPSNVVLKGYLSVEYSSSGIYRANKKGKYGLVTAEGKELTSFIYDDLSLDPVKDENGNYLFDARKGKKNTSIRITPQGQVTTQ